MHQRSMNESDVARRKSLLRSIRLILGHLRSFPVDFYPTEDETISKSSYVDVSDRGYRRTVEYIFKHHFSQWPPDVLTQFMALSFMIANEAALAREDHPNLNVAHLNRKKPKEAEQALQLEGLLFGGRLRQYATADPILNAKLRFASRHFSAYQPYENLIYTFLGPSAFEYLNLSSKEGRPKVQPHEASREEWINLYKIDCQVLLDLELSALSAVDRNQAKDLVVAAWGIAALMAYLSPSVFLNEASPYVSSVREKALTVSTGKETRIILSPRPSSVVDGLESITDLIGEDVFDAVDLMWIAHSFLDVESVRVPYSTEYLPQTPSYNVFLSHRGRDAKVPLLRKLIDHRHRDGVFLDCLVLARSCVNRLFVYQSLASSKSVFLITTENYSNSEWCLKERAFAEYLSSRRRLVCKEFRTVDLAWQALCNETSGIDDGILMENRGKAESPLDFTPTPGPLWFIYSDYNKEDRAPNRKTIGQHEPFVNSVSQWVTFVGDLSSSDERSPESLASAISQAAFALLNGIVGSVPENETAIDVRTFKGLPIIPLDILIVFAQLFFGLISIGTQTSNKVESRQAADRFLSLVPEFVDLARLSEDCGDERWFDYLVAIAVAAALQFDRYACNDLPIRVGRHLCPGAAIIRQRHVLFDVRAGTELRNFRLRLAALLIRHGIGTAGIVQSAVNTVHDKAIDGFELSVLPCVTVYPEMADILGLDARQANRLR